MIVPDFRQAAEGSAYLGIIRHAGKIKFLNFNQTEPHLLAREMNQCV